MRLGKSTAQAGNVRAQASAMQRPASSLKNACIFEKRSVNKETDEFGLGKNLL